jgi:hypothetical protein
VAVRRWPPVWLMVTAVSAVLGLWLGNEMLTPKAGVGVPRDQAPISRLPANARNVTYYLRPPVAYYEFDTDEAGFEEWVGKWQLAWKDRGEGSLTAIIWDHDAGRRGEVTIQDGIGYGWWEADAGWFLTYDRRTGRAYCSGNYR